MTTQVRRVGQAAGVAGNSVPDSDAMMTNARLIRIVPCLVRHPTLSKQMVNALADRRSGVQKKFVDALNVTSLVVGIAGGIASVVALLIALYDRTRPQPHATHVSIQPVGGGEVGEKPSGRLEARQTGRPRNTRLTLLLLTPWIFAAGFFLSGWFTNDVFHPGAQVMWGVTLGTGGAVSAAWVIVVIKRTASRS